MGTILVTGGAGYIGSHTVVELLNAGHQVLIVDNLCNSSIAVLDRIEPLAGRNFRFVQADVRDGAALDRIFAEHPVDGVIHFAGLKAVGESVAQPLRYFDNNIGSTLALLQAMDRADVRRIVFSSSATVYGDPEQVPITEDSRLQVTNPYGRTKLMCEDILRDLQQADARWQVAILRYFNPVGAHESGTIGEHPNGIPNNLMPFITQVAVGQREFLSIFGRDYPTPDGTGVRDYIHVVDLAQGHLAALSYLQQQQTSITVNLGTGRGVSVQELADTFARVTGVPVPYRFVDRRPGDVAACYADTRLAREALGWQAQLGVERMCADAWRWQSQNPKGY
ncbi:UDP-glucose 4-epimerase GalE [Limnohabitans sp. 2KL-1]|jgi:UDP-glucose 4-epimerase|uniref:UDP-glucose 4-epimerase GalE n=1 Tax=Limnohabitans sp. 2KL-1 TaxID=1100699 RepID=UPI000D3763E4|nr:UDP-glucose 4-epimerase GalE [Limnohabitans sp. 2KL-1]PUE45183.1 UDP-glucose 4-epimerase GalE [Limnohabitans sp. 2KL-1]